MWARPSGLRTFEATFAVTFITARRLVVSPGETLSIGFRVLVSRHPAIQTTGLLTLAPAGLSPAEHASLRWTHNRTCIALSPIRDPLHRRLQPFCYLHDCSGCFRLERLLGGARTHWKAP